MVRGMKRGGKICLKSTIPFQTRTEEDGYITTLHPEGSFNNIKFYEPKKRDLKRPDINIFTAIINALLPVIVYIGICFWDIRIASLLFGLYIVIRLRSIIIWFIQLYQRYASDEIRLSCVFEPSCSEYMILSINKYGIIYGGIKGIKRLKRCHFPNGGIDYP
jgi:putative membrane protein insertion efficiency factor